MTPSGIKPATLNQLRKRVLQRDKKQILNKENKLLPPLNKEKTLKLIFLTQVVANKAQEMCWPPWSLFEKALSIFNSKILRQKQFLRRT
jgi:hypothetical protein